MNIIKSIFNRLCSYRNSIQFRIDCYSYLRRLPRLHSEIFGKEKIKVVFFPINIGMWKNDYLFDLMLKHPRFDPCVVSFFVPTDSWDYQLRNQHEMQLFFESKGYPYYNMYDPATRKWFDIENFQPDLIFYAQGAGVGIDRYNIKALWHRCIFYYIPYCFQLENQTQGYNTLLDNICEAFFVPAEFYKRYYSSFFWNKAKNVVVTGYPLFDYLRSSEKIISSMWKCGDGRKRIIWAPHHSISDNDILNCSNFLDIADDMVKLAQHYKDRIEFVFKPHPRLRPKLEEIPEWGAERTAQYYNLWKSMENTNYIDGEYYDLFRSSDAMIHDSSSFIVEYLVTEKPVMFVLKPGGGPNLNEYAQSFFNHHYIGSTIDEIKSFINQVVLDGNDVRKEERQRFVRNQLQELGNTSVARNIFDVIEGNLL